MEGGVFKVLMIPTLVVETVISQNFVLTQVYNVIANFVLKTDRQTDWLNEAPCRSLKNHQCPLRATRCMLHTLISNAIFSQKKKATVEKLYTLTFATDRVSI